MKVLFTKPPLGRGARGLRLGKGDRDTGLIGQDICAVEVTTVGNDKIIMSFALVELAVPRGILGPVRS